MKRNDNTTTIFDTLGQAAIRTLGAYGHVEVSDLSLKIPVENSRKCHMVEIERNGTPEESYRVIFYRNNFQGLVTPNGRSGLRVVAEHDEVLPADLNGVISNETGIPVYWN